MRPGVGACGRRAAAWLLALGAPLALGCGDRASNAAPAPRPRLVEVETVTSGPATEPLEAPGVVEAAARVSLRFREAGYIARFAAQEGDTVEAGAVVALLETGDLERALRIADAEVARARARAEAAEAASERYERLHAELAASAEQLERAQSEARVARAQLRRAELEREAARDRLRKAILRAPFRGRIERRLIDAYEFAPADAPIVVLVQLDPVTVRAHVPDTALPRIGPGMEVALRANMWPGRRFRGAIARVGVAANPATRTFQIEVEVDNPDHALRPEMVVSVHLDLPAGDRALTVPLGAVLRDGGPAAFCFAVERETREAGARAHRREVVLGPVRGERVVVREGLEPGERVIVRGQHFVRPGDLVRVAGE